MSVARFKQWCIRTFGLRHLFYGLAVVLWLSSLGLAIVALSVQITIVALMAIPVFVTARRLANRRLGPQLNRQELRRLVGFLGNCPKDVWLFDAQSDTSFTVSPRGRFRWLFREVHDAVETSLKGTVGSEETRVVVLSIKAYALWKRRLIMFPQSRVLKGQPGMEALEPAEPQADSREMGKFFADTGLAVVTREDISSLIDRICRAEPRRGRPY